MKLGRIKHIRRCTLRKKYTRVITCLVWSSGVKFAPSTKEFTVSVPLKGNAVFNMEKKVCHLC